MTAIGYLASLRDILARQSGRPVGRRALATHLIALLSATGPRLRGPEGRAWAELAADAEPHGDNARVLKIGDSLRRKIDRGLASSRFGIVVLSQAFFGRGWPEYELDGLVTRAVSGEQILLPIWHNVSKREVIAYSPSLADRVARSTGTKTVEEIAAEIVEVVRVPAAAA